MRMKTGLLIAAAAMLAVPGIAAAQDVTIGVVGPLTGPAANTGVAAKQAMEYAVKQWNAGNGPSESDNPPQVKLLFEDSQSRPEVGVSAGQKLFTRDNVDMLIGDTLHSSVTMAMMELAPQFQKPVLSAEPVSTAIADKVSSDPEKYKYFWKGDYNSDGYGRAVHGFYKWMIEEGKLKPESKTIAFVIEETDYGRSNAEIISQLFAEDGWKTTEIEAVPLGAADFYPQLSKLRQNPPDIVVSVFSAANSGIAFVKQFKEQGLKSSSMGIYYPTKPEFMQQAGDAAEGMVWASLQFAPDLYPQHKEFSDAIQAEYGNPATFSHAEDYCVMNIALKAIEKAGGNDPAKISEALGNTDYDCIIGRYVFDPKDHAIKSGPDFLPVPVAQVQGGKNVVLWPSSVATAEYKE